MKPWTNGGVKFFVNDSPWFENSRLFFKFSSPALRRSQGMHKGRVRRDVDVLAE